jgi:Fic family protein
MKQGYGFVQYISFEHIIEKRKDDYYKALMDGQKNRYQENERIDGWVLFFLDCLVTLTKRLEAKYEVYSNLKPSLNLRQQKVLEFIKEQKTVQMASIEFAFAEESRNTLKKDLAYLVREKLILKTGERKGTCYHAKKEVNPY